MEIRPAMSQDLPRILELFEQARQFMREHGNPNQWGTHDPPREQIEEDIRREGSYLCLHHGTVVGTFAFLPGPDATYARLQSGAWLNDWPYWVLHRVAAPDAPKGTGTALLQWCQKHADNIRGDTHRQNVPMQGLLQKCGFSQVGTLLLPNGSERLAFHYVRLSHSSPMEESKK